MVCTTVPASSLPVAERQSRAQRAADFYAKNDQVSEAIRMALEADNVELKHKATLATREAESLQREAHELGELKVQNKELTQCLKSMEDSRKQYESDAQRYKVQYETAEKKSDGPLDRLTTIPLTDSLVLDVRMSHAVIGGSRMGIEGLPYWEQIHIPSLYIAGELSDRMNSRIAAQMLACCPQLQFSGVPAANHHVTLDNPLGFNAALRQFLGQ